MKRPIYRNSLYLCACFTFAGSVTWTVPLPSQMSGGLAGWDMLSGSPAWADSARTSSTADGLTDLEYVAESDISDPGTSKRPEPSLPLRRTSPLVVEPIAPPVEPGKAGALEPESGSGVNAQTLGSAKRDMIRLNPVVAVVEGEKIRWKDVVESARDLPEEYQSRIESVFPALLDRLIDLKLLANAARSRDLDEDETLQRRVRVYEDSLLREAYIAQTVAPEIAEADVRARYFKVLRANAGTTERHLRHVVVKSRDEALAVVQSLDDGLGFAELARNYSIGGSAASGGDLGFMRRDSLDDDFAAAAFDLRIGSYSSKPLKTEFGWHVIKVEGERKADLPAYEAIAPKLREELARERLSATLKKLRANADLELFPEN